MSSYIPTHEEFFMNSKFLPYLIKKPEYGLLTASIGFVILMLLLFYKRRKDK